MNLVCAGLDRDEDGASHSESVLRGEVARDNTKLGDGIDRGLNGLDLETTCASRLPGIVIHAVDLNVDLPSVLAAGRESPILPRTASDGWPRARGEARQFQIVSAIQRQVDDSRVVDYLADCGRFGIDCCR